MFMILFFRYHIKQDKERDRQFMIRLKAESYSGIIDQKYIDTANHQYETLIIQTDSGQKVIICNMDNSGLFNYSEVGDSIVKHDESYMVDIYKNDEGKASFSIFINLFEYINNSP